MSCVYEFDLLVILPMVEIGFIWLWVAFYEFFFSVGDGYKLVWNVKGWLEESLK
jgi:hypothetical protein